METARISFGKALPVLAVASQTIGNGLPVLAVAPQTVGNGLPVLAVAPQTIGNGLPVLAVPSQTIGNGLPVLAVAPETIGEGLGVAAYCRHFLPCRRRLSKRGGGEVRCAVVFKWRQNAATPSGDSRLRHLSPIPLRPPLPPVPSPLLPWARIETRDRRPDLLGVCGVKASLSAAAPCASRCR